jgi:hypothetical protein
MAWVPSSGQRGVDLVYQNQWVPRIPVTSPLDSFTSRLPRPSEPVGPAHVCHLPARLVHVPVAAAFRTSGSRACLSPPLDSFRAVRPRSLPVRSAHVCHLRSTRSGLSVRVHFQCVPRMSVTSALLVPIWSSRSLPVRPAHVRHLRSTRPDLVFSLTSSASRASLPPPARLVPAWLLTSLPVGPTHLGHLPLVSFRPGRSLHFQWVPRTTATSSGDVDLDMTDSPLLLSAAGQCRTQRRAGLPKRARGGVPVWLRHRCERHESPRSGISRKRIQARPIEGRTPGTGPKPS